MSTEPFADALGLPYTASDHTTTCSSKSRAVGKSGKRRELHPRPIPTLCDCGVRAEARKKWMQLRDAAPDLAEQLEEAVSILRALRAGEPPPVPLLDCIDSSVAVLHQAGRP